MPGLLHQGTSGTKCPAWLGASLRAWRVSRWVLGTAGTSAGQVLRVGSIAGTEAGVFISSPGLYLGHLCVDGVGDIGEHQPTGPLQWALRGESGLQRDGQRRQGY